MMDDLKKDFGGDVCSDGMETDEDRTDERSYRSRRMNGRTDEGGGGMFL